jgi:hypothetical protein
MALAVVRDNHLNFNGIQYFRGNSSEVDLGSYGEKRAPAFGANYLEVYRNIPPRKLKIKEVSEVEIDFDRSTQADIEGGFTMGDVIGASSGNIYSRMSSGELKLVKFSVSIADMVDAANESPRALEHLIDMGNGARIAHQIFVVMEASLARSMSVGKTFDVKVTAGDIEVSAEGDIKINRNTSVTLAEGTTFAYLLLNPEWDHKRKSKRTRIVGARDDQWGLN